MKCSSLFPLCRLSDAARQNCTENSLRVNFIHGSFQAQTCQFHLDSFVRCSGSDPRVSILILQASSGQLVPAQASSGQPKPAQAASDQLRPAQASSGQLRLAQARSGQLRPAQASSGQLRPPQASSGQLRPELRPARASSGQLRPAQASSLPEHWKCIKMFKNV